MRITRNTPYLLSICILQATAVAASAGDVEYAESLVRTVYYEGMPATAAAQLSEAGSARLIEMLGDDSEARQHAQIVIALGMCGHAGNFEALRGFIARLRSGELDRDEFRAWRALPDAMGYLARTDPRALAWLILQLRDTPEDQRRFGKHDLIQLRRRAAARGLGLSGQPQARAVLNEMAASGGDGRFAQALARAIELHDSVDVPALAGARAEAMNQ